MGFDIPTHHTPMTQKLGTASSAKKTSKIAKSGNLAKPLKNKNLSPLSNQPVTRPVPVPTPNETQALVDSNPVNHRRAVDLSQALDINQGSLDEQLGSLDQVLTPVNLISSSGILSLAEDTDKGGFLIQTLFVGEWGADEDLAKGIKDSQDAGSEVQNVTLSTPSSQSNFSNGTRRALVVGNFDYQNLPDLNGVKKDLKTVPEALASHGYESPTVLENSTAPEIIQGLKDLVTASTEGDIITFVYAGHSTTTENDSEALSGYLLGVGVTFDTMESGEQNIGYGDLQDVIQAAQEKGVQLNIVLDSCQSGAFVHDEATRKLETLGQVADFMDQLAEKHEFVLSPEGVEGVDSHLKTADQGLEQAKTSLQTFDEITKVTFESGDPIALLLAHTQSDGTVDPALIAYLKDKGMGLESIKKTVVVLDKLGHLGKGVAAQFKAPESSLEPKVIKFRGSETEGVSYAAEVLDYLMDQEINPQLIQAQESLGLARKLF